MKKIFLCLLVFVALGIQAQTVYEVNYPGKTIETAALDSVSGDNTYVYFAFKQTVHSYAIQVDVLDTIEGPQTGAFLEGGNVKGGLYAAVGDSLVINDSVAVFSSIRIWTGTTWPYGHGRIKIPDYTVTEGSLKITITYN